MSLLLFQCGKVTKVGPKVSEFKIGDTVGVGAQVCSCTECSDCKEDNEQYCTKGTFTYNMKYPNGDQVSSLLQFSD